MEDVLMQDEIPKMFRAAQGRGLLCLATKDGAGCTTQKSTFAIIGEFGGRIFRFCQSPDEVSRADAAPVVVI